MNLSDGYHAIPPGKLANVQTFLEMRAKPALRPSPDGPWRLERLARPDLPRYRAAVHRVGDEYLWCLRLAMPDAELERFLLDPLVEAYLLVTGAGDEGVLELDFRVERECELSLFGVAGSLIRTGAGRRLMNHAIEIAWSHPIERFWLHTCTLDHPSALAFYRRSGFRDFKRVVEIYDDPRALGITHKDAAPHVPIL
ncbi:MAG TPA: GNAT family N-acetyltransferase [Candidatus Cybelea sp.]